ncbi:MAG TPA: phosphoribosylglycinamide formyltransferase [Stellaceae bacterium]|nr:phosphoribosylglycinamide formyltransferase [Stellaceae bacterium]
MARLRLGVLISGRGSNLQALIEAACDPAYPAEIALVVSNRDDAAGLARAAAAGIPAAVVAQRDSRRFAEETQALLRGRDVGLVCLAGFMRVLEEGFVEAWRDRMINIHPSLLPMFKGLHAQRQALAAGVRFTGCTVHFVRPEIDAGPIIAQAVVPVHAEDDEERLSDRILAVEHRLYPLVVRLLADGRVRVAGGRVAVAGARPPQIAALNPTDGGGEWVVTAPG